MWSAIVLAVVAASTHAADGWVMRRTDRDIAFQRGEERFSLAAYAARQVPAGYAAGPANDEGCRIDVELTPLSLQGDVLSVWMIYRAQPGDCDPPLRDSATQSVVALRLPDGRPVTLTELLPPDAVAHALRNAGPVRALVAGQPAAPWPDLLVQLDTATRTQCDRRITRASLSQFYVANDHGHPQLRLAWINDCGQLGDEPALEGFALDAPAPPSSMALEHGKPLHLSFVPAE